MARGRDRDRDRDRTGRGTLRDWRLAVVSALVRVLVRVPSRKSKKQPDEVVHKNDDDDGSTSTATTTTTAAAAAAAAAAATATAATTTAATPTATGAAAALTDAVSGSAFAGGGVMGTAASAVEEEATPAREPAGGGGRGPWEINLGIPYEDISGVRPLAEGTACSCSRGTLGSKQLVIKTLGAKSSETDAQDLDRELSVLQLLHHPHIVRLVGAGQTPKRRMFVATEYLSRGTLSAAIGTDSPEGSSWIWRARVRSWFPMEEALRQAAGVASALAYMHDEAIPGAKVVHRDIKGSNLAFAADGTLKLFDLGLAKILRPQDLLSDNVYKMTGNTGSLRYMSPEVARSLPANETADVYSFAIVLWEMVSLEQPFHFYGVKNMFEQVMMAGTRPRLATEWPEGLKDILSRCWSAEICERPGMAETAQRLLGLLPAPQPQQL